jgi:hypothetical protein
MSAIGPMTAYRTFSNSSSSCIDVPCFLRANIVDEITHRCKRRVRLQLASLKIKRIKKTAGLERKPAV